MSRPLVSLALLLAGIGFLSLLPGCGMRGSTVAAPTARSDGPSAPVFTDVAAAAGIQFRQGHAGKRPLNILEATGSGCAFLDFDNDGTLDLLFVGQPRCALYRGRGNGTFEDVTAAAGLARDGFWIGCGTGDYDNDGAVDLFVTGYRICALYHNTGNGVFTDVTGQAGIRERGWQTSCAFGDVDRDGFLDLYVGRYVRFGPRDLQYCAYGDTTVKVACGPDAYEPEIGVFYRNQGDGTFVEATRRWGMQNAHGKAWGAAFADFDDDGWQDLYVANDEMPADLFHNTGRGRMENVGVVSGTASNRDGGVQGGMGADFGDYDNDGRLDLFVTTFWMEPKSLYHNDGGGSFSEPLYPAGIAAATLKRVGWGTRWADLNQDGWLDLLVVNGHVRDGSAVNDQERMPQSMQLFLNQGNGRFRDVSARAGEPFARSIVGRGAALGDYDSDGDLDAAVVDMEGAALLLRNEGPPHPGHWLIVRARCARGARDALGARLTLEAGGSRQVREVQTSGSVLSAADPRAHFGLSAASRGERLTIRWPDGLTDTWTDLPVDRELQAEQGKGIQPAAQHEGN